MRSIEWRTVMAAGGPTVVAKHFRVTPSCVQMWIQRKRIPAEYVQELSKMSKVFTPEKIRPDIYQS